MIYETINSSSSQEKSLEWRFLGSITGFTTAFSITDIIISEWQFMRIIAFFQSTLGYIWISYIVYSVPNYLINCTLRSFILKNTPGFLFIYSEILHPPASTHIALPILPIFLSPCPYPFLYGYCSIALRLSYYFTISTRP